MTEDVNQIGQAIELILSDVDGVLTDGGVIYDNQAVESKRFNIRDGTGIKLWQRAGHRFGIVTGRSSHIVEVRAAELGIGLIRQAVDDKLGTVKQILHDLKLKPHQVCYIGDDLPDIPVIRSVGLGVAVADACEELREAARYTTRLSGGQGAVREVVEMILKQQGRWEQLIRKYTGR